MINNSTTHYQTSFIISKTTGSPFHELQILILDWLQNKRGCEFDKRLYQNRQDFFRKCEFSNLYRTNNKIVTNTYFEKESEISSNVWAMRYQHTDSKLGRRRYWYTDITLRERDEAVVFYARVSYAWNREDLGVEHSIPDTNIPGFIKRIITSDFKVYSVQKTFCLKDVPLVVSRPGQGKPLADSIESKERKYPLIVVHGEEPHLIDEARFLAKNLAGKCQVFVIKENPELAEEIQTYLNKDYLVRKGEIRVFFSINDRFRNPRRHRFYNPASEDYPNQRVGIINGLLRTHPLVERDAVESVYEIDSLIRKLNFKDFIANHQDQKDELEPIFEELEFNLSEKKELEEKLQIAEQEADEYAQMVDDLEGKKWKLESKIQSLSQKQDLQISQNNKIKLVDSLHSLPTSLAEVVNCFKIAHSDKLVFAEGALESCKEYDQFSDVNEAWKMFSDLVIKLWNLKFDDSMVFEEQTFNHKSRYTLAMTEGRNTKRDAHLMALRKIKHNGKEYDITPHIKLRNSGSKMLRIYFAFDEEKRKIVVGHIGPHLDNATTKTLR